MPAAAVNPLFNWFFIAVLAIYVPGTFSRVSFPDLLDQANCPGSYILYTHMIAQRRKALAKKN